jgi:hypothetical protein
LETFRHKLAFAESRKEKEKDTVRETMRDYSRLFELLVLRSYGIGFTYAVFRDVGHIMDYVSMSRASIFAALKDMRESKIAWRLPHARKALAVYVNPAVKAWVPFERLIAHEAWEVMLAESNRLVQYTQLELKEMPIPDKTLLQSLAHCNLEAAINQSPQRGLGDETESPQRGLSSSRSVAPPVPAAGTHSSPHIYVKPDRDLNDLKRSTMSGLYRRGEQEEHLLEAVRELFLELEGETATEKEMSTSGGFWRKCAFFRPGRLQSAIDECRNAGKENRINSNSFKFLTDTFKDFCRVDSCDQIWESEPGKRAAWESRLERRRQSGQQSRPKS